MKKPSFILLTALSNLYIALYGTIQPFGGIPFADKIVEIVIDAVKTKPQTKPSNKHTDNRVYQSLCESTIVNIFLEFPVQSVDESVLIFKRNPLSINTDKIREITIHFLIID